MRSLSTIFTRISSLLRSDFIHKVLLVILLSSAIMLADSAFQLFDPSVQFVETSYEDNQITVFKYFGAPVFYNVRVVKTYRIKLPLFPVRGLNLSIPNPSNFSVYDGTKYVPWEQDPFAINVEADPGLAFTLLTNLGRNVTSIDVSPLNGSLVKPECSIEFTFNDLLDAQFINMTQPVEVNLRNGSILVTMSLIINNTDYRRLHSERFALFDVQNYGNATSLAFLENGTLKLSQLDIWQQWLWASFSVDAYSYANFTISAVFEENQS